MKTIKKSVINEIIIKNSRFITLLIKITDDSNIENILDKIKQDYPKATHYCYAYITTSKQKSNDDKEPSGTAGIPMLSVLEKEQIINVLAVTIRYFGGIKLGAGGLVRAYSKSVREALTKAIKEEIIPGYKISLTIPYNMQKNLDYLLKDYQIIDKNYQEQITYIIKIPKENISPLKNYNYQILNEEYIEKIHCN